MSVSSVQPTAKYLVIREASETMASFTKEQYEKLKNGNVVDGFVLEVGDQIIKISSVTRITTHNRFVEEPEAYFLQQQ